MILRIIHILFHVLIVTKIIDITAHLIGYCIRSAKVQLIILLPLKYQYSKLCEVSRFSGTAFGRGKLLRLKYV